MNKERRNKISALTKQLEALTNHLSNILTDEEIAFDSMPENLQGSMRGEESEEAIEILSEAIDALRTACENLEEI